MAAANAAGRAGLERDHDRAAPALDESEPEGRIRRLAERHRVRPVWRSLEDLVDKANGFEQLIEAQSDSSGDVALGAPHLVWFESIVRRRGWSGAQLVGRATGAPGEPGGPGAAREGGGDNPATEKGVPHALVVI